MKVIVKGDGAELIEDLVRHVKDGDFDSEDEDVREVVRKVKKRIFVERAEEGGTDLLIRGMSPDMSQRFKTAAGARAMKYSEYLTALIKLHDEMRSAAERDERLRAQLEELGLGTVTV